MESPNARERVKAVRNLRHIPARQASSLLLQALDDDAIDVVLTALSTIGEVRLRPASERVATFLGDRTSEIRTAAAETLGVLGARDQTNALVMALGDSSGEVRVAAIRSLGSLRDPTAVPAIEATHTDDNKDVLVAALRELGGFGDRTTVYAIMEMARAPAVRVRVAAVMALGELRDPRATETLLSLIANQPADVRRASLKAIGAIGDPGAVEPLHTFLTPTHGAETLIRVVHTLGKLGDPRSVEPLLSLVRHGDYADHAASALIAIGNPAAPTLIDELTHTEDVRYQAKLLYMLARIPTLESADVLHMALETRRYNREDVIKAVSQAQDPKMAELIAPIIKELTETQLIDLAARIHPFADDRLARPLLERYPSLGRDARLALLMLFGALNDPSVVPVVLEELGNEDVVITRAAALAAQQIAAPELVDGLTYALRADDVETRRAAALALASIADENTVERLLEAVRDNKHPARRDAMWALGFAVRGNEASEAQEMALSILDDPHHPLAYVALEIIATAPTEGAYAHLEPLFITGRLSLQRKILEVASIAHLSEAIPLVELALSSNDESLVAEAAWAAGVLNAKDLAPRLLELSESTTGPVACNALSSLATLGVADAADVAARRLYDPNPYVASNALLVLRTLGEVPNMWDLDVLLHRATNPFLREALYRSLRAAGDDALLREHLSDERNATLAARVLAWEEEAKQASFEDSWVVIDVSDGGERIIGTDIYLLLPDGHIKAAYSDENGKVRVELEEPGVVRQLPGSRPFTL